MTTTQKDLPLRFVQIGDLHLTDSNLQNHRDFIRIVDELNRNMGGFVDFVFPATTPTTARTSSLRSCAAD